MVDIIKKGILPGSKKYRGNCSNCKTEFTFLASEARYVTDQREGDYYEIRCPLHGCGHTVLASVRSTVA